MKDRVGVCLQFTRRQLKRSQLWKKREAVYATLSGGQKLRLTLAPALLNDPSADLDPQARLEIHQLVEDLRAEKRTILLTTHSIEEAEKLFGRVAVVDEGRIIAVGTPREIQQRTPSRFPRAICRRGAKPKGCPSTTGAPGSR